MSGLAGLGDRAPAARAPVGARAWRACVAWLALAGVAAAAPWLGEGVTVVAFACVSWQALRVALPRSRAGSGDRALAIACFASVPLQYGWVAAHAWQPFVAMLPLATLMVLPLLVLVVGDTRHLLDRVAERGFVVMLYVYCVSHAPAVFLLDVPGLGGYNGMLVAFLVVTAHAGAGVRSARAWFPARRAGRSDGRDGAGTGAGAIVSMRMPPVPLDAPLAVAVGACIGAAFTLALPVPVAVAAAGGGLLALLGWLGSAVLARLRDDGAALPPGQASRWREALARPDALCFAAPVFLHALHAVSR